LQMGDRDKGSEDINYDNEPYREVYKLYLMHTCFSLISRMWEMSIVLLTAQVSNNSLTLVAMSGFLSSLSLFLFMPSIGSWLDRTNRIVVVMIALLSKLTFLTVTYILCAILLWKEAHNTATTQSLHFYLYAIPVLYACASLSFSAITQSIEKDWLVVLSNGNSSWLTSTNSVMSQIDLAASALGPAITGIIMSFTSYSFSALLFLILNAVVTALLYIFMHGLYSSWPALAVRVQRPQAVDPSASATRSHQYQPVQSTEDGTDIKKRGQYSLNGEDGQPIPTTPSLFTRIVSWLSLSEFYHSGCGGVMVSYSFLYATVLSFGSLMMVYLRWAGMSDHWIGIARGVNSLFGFLGAYLFPTMKNAVGLRKAGIFSLWFQCINVCIAATSFVLLSPFQAMIAVTVLTVMCILLVVVTYDVM
jgi:iron-regulated transporter 1